MFKRNLADQTRVIMAAVNPVPAGAYDDDPRAVNEIAARLTMLRSAEPVSYQPDHPSRTFVRPDGSDGTGRTRTITWRVAAPVLSGLAVAAVLVSLAVAGAAAPARHGAVTPSVPAMPRYYLTINGLPPHAKAIVRSTRTGRTLASISLPKDSELATEAAAPSDRVFFLAIIEPGPSTNPDSFLYRVSLSASGHWHLSAKTLLISGGKDLVGVTGIAVSPNGSRLAATIADFRGTSPVPVGEIMVFPLHGGPARVWAAPSHPADTAGPVWVSETSLAFLWNDRLKVEKANSYYAARTQERLLDTSAPGHNVLSSRVLATASGPHGFLFDSAYLAHDPSQIIASVYRNVPFVGARGTAVVRLESISAATGKVIKVFATRTVRYRTASARSQADNSLAVFGVDASGRYALVYAPRFGILSGGMFVPRPSGPGVVYSAAW